jgi:hypothetical protein
MDERRRGPWVIPAAGMPIRSPCSLVHPVMVRRRAIVEASEAPMSKTVLDPSLARTTTRLRSAITT